jgi:hypothetical protein
MDGCRKSDSLRVSAQPPSKGAGAPGPAEGVERRGLAEGNLVEHHRGRTQRQEILPQARDPELTIRLPEYYACLVILTSAV